jgi:hypothetical protein
MIYCGWFGCRGSIRWIVEDARGTMVGIRLQNTPTPSAVRSAYEEPFRSETDQNKAVDGSSRCGAPPAG